MKKRFLLVIIVAVLIGAGVYLATRLESGPAVKLALKSSELGLNWEGSKLYTCYEGRAITQDFLKTIEVDENTRLFKTVYQNIAVYPNSEAALENEDLKHVRRSFPESSMGLSFWDESYAAPIMDGVGIALRKSNIVVLLIWREGYYPKDPMTGKFASGYGGNFTEISPQQEETVQNFLCNLAQIIKGKIIETNGGQS